MIARPSGAGIWTFQTEADYISLSIPATVSVAPLRMTRARRLLRCSSSGPMRFSSLGWALRRQRSPRTRGWSGPCAINTSGGRGPAPDYARAVHGWTYVDMYSDRNTTLAVLCDRLDLP